MQTRPIADSAKAFIPVVLGKGRARLVTQRQSLPIKMGLNPFAGAVYAFRNRRCNRLKLLIYDRNGFWLLMKRLEQDRFVWPRRTQAVLELTVEQLQFSRCPIVQAVQQALLYPSPPATNPQNLLHYQCSLQM